MDRYFAELVVSKANKESGDHFKVVENKDGVFEIQRHYISGEVWHCFKVVFETKTTLCQHDVDGPFTKTLYNVFDVDDLKKYVDDAVKYITLN